MHIKFWITILLAAVCSSVQAAPTTSANNSTKLSLTEHHNRTRNFKCASPQPRAYIIKNLLDSNALGTDERIEPPSTVIYMCDEGTGCCSNYNAACGPVEGAVEYEEVEVLVTRVIAGEKKNLVLKIEHHKRCECQPKHDGPARKPKVTLIR